MDDNVNISEKIFEKKVSSGLSFECIRKVNREKLLAIFYETRNDNKQVLDTVSIAIASLDKNYSWERGFYKFFKIIDVNFIESTQELSVIVDRFGSLDLYSYKLSDKTNSSGNPGRRVITLKEGALVPRDVMLLGEDFQDVKVYNSETFLLSRSLYQKPSDYSIYKIDHLHQRMDLFSADIVDMKSHAKKIACNISPEHQAENIKKVISTIYPANENKIDVLYSLESSGYKRLKLGGLFYVVKVNDKEKLLYTGDKKEWYIQDMKWSGVLEK